MKINIEVDAVLNDGKNSYKEVMTLSEDVARVEYNPQGSLFVKFYKHNDVCVHKGSWLIRIKRGTLLNPEDEWIVVPNKDMMKILVQNKGGNDKLLDPLTTDGWYLELDEEDAARYVKYDSENKRRFCIFCLKTAVLIPFDIDMKTLISLFKIYQSRGFLKRTKGLTFDDLLWEKEDNGYRNGSNAVYFNDNMTVDTNCDYIDVQTLVSIILECQRLGWIKEKLIEPEF